MFIGGKADLKRDVVGRADLVLHGTLWRAVFGCEDGDQPPVAGVEVEMIDGMVVQIGLLEHERHAQHTFPEIDAGLAIRPVQCDVVHALCLDPLHRLSPFGFPVG